MSTNLTEDEVTALLAVKNGADVYSYKIARTLREIQRTKPHLIDIGKAMMYRGDGTDQMPYFAAICTAAGRDALREAVTPPQPRRDELEIAN